jgi:hypothetical protein
VSWSNFQEEAFNQTKAETKRLNSEIRKEYKRAIKNISTKLDKVYSQILSGLKPEDYYNKMIERNRLSNLLAQIRKEYSESYSKIYNYIRNILGISFSNTYYRKAYTLQWIEPRLKLGILPKNLIELTTLGTNQAFKEITKSIEKRFGNKSKYVPQTGSLTNLLANNRIKEVNQIRSAITQSLVNGQSKTETINTIKNIIGTEKRIGRKTKITGARASAERILRTETNRVINMGSYAQSKSAEDQGVEIKRKLVAVLDNRTRPQSASMDGQTVGIDQPFRYPDGKKALTPGTTGNPAYDINDRETVVDIVGDYEPEIRRGRNPITGKNEVFSYKDFDQWAKDNNLTKNVYGQIISK